MPWSAAALAKRCQPFCWTKDAEQLLATLERPTGSG
jgi:hypothetical protein